MLRTSTTSLLFLSLLLTVGVGVLPYVANADHCPDNVAHDAQGGCVGNTTDEQLLQNTELSNQGIFGCLGQGAQVANVGTTRAVGGVYVPVNDAAVTLNTGFLVYKECILDGMARKIAENISSETSRQQIEAFWEGNNGGAQFITNYDDDLEPRITAIYTHRLSDDRSLAPLCQAFRDSARRTIARSRLSSINDPYQVYACPVSTSADETFYRSWFRLVEPTGNRIGATALFAGDIYDDTVRYERNFRDLTASGIIPRFDANANPLAQRVITPGVIIASAIAQVTGSGFRQLENASEIDQVVSNLFAGLTTRLLASGSGIPGLFVSSGTQPAYIDRMVAQTQAAVRSGAVNAALIALQGYRQGEAAYLEAKNGIATALINAIAQLRSYESQCWDLIIPAVQTHAQANGNPTLTIATSTQFSDAVIDSPQNNIRGLATTTAAEITASEQALATIDQLIANAANTNSAAAQQQAILQADQMIANGQLHSQQDAQVAATGRDSITSALTTLLDNTRTEWADSQDANVGWCNVNNPAVVERWFNEWR